MLYLRDLPKYESIRQQAQRYPQIDPRAVESFLVLLRVASDVLSGFEALLAQFGMSQGKFTVLMVLNRDPSTGLSPSELADRCGVTRATMTGLLDGLEREKLIHREGNATDRRKAVVSLTAKAGKLLDRILPSYYSQVASLMGDLQEEQKVQLIDLLVKVNDRLLSLWEAARRNGGNHVAADPEVHRGNNAATPSGAAGESPSAHDP